MRMAKWVLETMYVSYLNTIPVKAAKARAGFSPDEPDYKLKIARGKLEPP